MNGCLFQRRAHQLPAAASSGGTGTAFCRQHPFRLLLQTPPRPPLLPEDCDHDQQDHCDVIKCSSYFFGSRRGQRSVLEGGCGMYLYHTPLSMLLTRFKHDKPSFCSIVSISFIDIFTFLKSQVILGYLAKNIKKIINDVLLVLIPSSAGF